MQLRRRDAAPSAGSGRPRCRRQRTRPFGSKPNNQCDPPAVLRVAASLRISQRQSPLHRARPGHGSTLYSGIGDGYGPPRMPDNAVVLLDALLAERDRLRGVGPLPADQAFELFAFEQCLKDADLSDEEIANGQVGGGDDGGIDGLYCFLSGKMLRFFRRDSTPRAFDAKLNSSSSLSKRRQPRRLARRPSRSSR